MGDESSINEVYVQIKSIIDHSSLSTTKVWLIIITLQSNYNQSGFGR